MTPQKTERQIFIDYNKLHDFHQFSITDNGIGIPQIKENIFAPFI